MKQFTKLLALVLALVLVLSVFAGCDTTKPTDPNTESKPNSSETKPNNQETQAPTDPEPEKIVFPLAEPVTFKIMVSGSKDYNENLTRCDWYQELVKRTNVHIEIEALGDSASTVLNARMQAGQEGDAIIGVLNDSMVVSLADAGKLQPIEKYVTSTNIMPNYNERAINEVPSVVGTMTTPDGHIYSVARIDGGPFSSWEAPLQVNKAWLKQVPGFEDGHAPKDLAEFTKVLKYFKENDMNGDGNTTDEIPFLVVSSSTLGDAQGTLWGILNWWGLNTKDGANYMASFLDDDGNVVFAPSTEAYKDAMKTINEWYEAGYLWAEFFTSNSTTYNETFNTDTAVWGFYNGASFANYGDTSTESWGTDTAYISAPDTGYDCKWFINPGFAGYKNTFTVTAKCEQPEILLAWLDQFYSLEGSFSTFYGCEDHEDRYSDCYDQWNIEDGKVVMTGITATDDQKTAHKQHARWGSIFGSYLYARSPSEYADGTIAIGMKEKARIDYIEANPDEFDAPYFTKPYFTADDTDILSYRWASVMSVITKYNTAFIKGEMDIDAKWDEFQKQLKLAGLEDMLDILQAGFDTRK